MLVEMFTYCPRKIVRRYNKRITYFEGSQRVFKGLQQSYVIHNLREAGDEGEQIKDKRLPLLAITIDRFIATSLNCEWWGWGWGDGGCGRGKWFGGMGRELRTESEKENL